MTWAITWKATWRSSPRPNSSGYLLFTQLAALIAAACGLERSIGALAYSGSCGTVLSAPPGSLTGALGAPGLTGRVGGEEIPCPSVPGIALPSEPHHQPGFPLPAPRMTSTHSW